MPNLDIGATITPEIDPPAYNQDVREDPIIFINEQKTTAKTTLHHTRCVSCFEEKDKAKQCTHCGWSVGDRPSSPFYLPPGTIIGDSYVVGKVLGHGGFGITYLSWDLELGIRIAIKEFLPDRVAGRDANHTAVNIYYGHNQLFEDGLTKFQEEAQALAKFQQHPCIITVYRFLRANSTGYMVMEYINGITLKTYLTKQQDNRIPWAQAIGIMTPIMEALRAVHATGLLHRDISPDNIYLTHDQRVKLLDFGAARQAIGVQSSSLSVILKEGFAPEEQYRRNGKQGTWTDVYGVAATIYCCITGEVPPASLDRMSADELKSLSALGVNIASKHEATLLRGLAIVAKDRWQTLEEMQQGLLEELPPPQLVPTPQQQPNNNSWLMWILMLIGLGIVGIATSVLQQQPSTEAIQNLAHKPPQIQIEQKLLQIEQERLQVEQKRLQIEQERRDNEKFDSATKENTETSYQAYLDNCRVDGCHYTVEATNRLKTLRNNRIEAELLEQQQRNARLLKQQRHSELRDAIRPSPAEITASPLPTSPLIPVTSQSRECTDKLIADRYSECDDATIVDTHHNLTWKRCSEGQIWTGGTCAGQAVKMVWNEAMRASQSLRDGWRMPHYEELRTLVWCSNKRAQSIAWKKTCGKKDKTPTINPEVFPGTPYGAFWTVSEHNDMSYAVGFDLGNVGTGTRSNPRYVRLVRSRR